MPGDVAQPLPVPWIVAEAIAVKLARMRPASVAIAGDHDRRVRTTLDQLSAEPGTQWDTIDGAADDAADGDDPVACLVFVGDGTTPTTGARQQALRLTERVRCDVVIAEPTVPGMGIGLQVLRGLDPTLLMLRSDEGARQRRRPWEPPVCWAVAEVAAWRFAPDAELAREGLLARLPRLSAPAAIEACRHVRARFPGAYEPFLLAAAALVDRGDVAGAHRVVDAVAVDPDAPVAAVAAVRRLVGMAAAHRNAS